MRFLYHTICASTVVLFGKFATAAMYGGGEDANAQDFIRKIYENIDNGDAKSGAGTADFDSANSGNVSLTPPSYGSRTAGTNSNDMSGLAKILNDIPANGSNRYPNGRLRPHHHRAQGRPVRRCIVRKNPRAASSFASSGDANGAASATPSKACVATVKVVSGENNGNCQSSSVQNGTPAAAACSSPDQNSAASGAAAANTNPTRECKVVSGPLNGVYIRSKRNDVPVDQRRVEATNAVVCQYEAENKALEKESMEEVLNSKEIGLGVVLKAMALSLARIIRRSTQKAIYEHDKKLLKAQCEIIKHALPQTYTDSIIYRSTISQLCKETVTIPQVIKCVTFDFKTVTVNHQPTAPQPPAQCCVPCQMPQPAAVQPAVQPAAGQASCNCQLPTGPLKCEAAAGAKVQVQPTPTQCVTAIAPVTNANDCLTSVFTVSA